MKFRPRQKFWIILAGVAFFLSCGTPDEKKMGFYDKGVALFESGDLVKARLELKNAIQIDPEFAKAYHVLGKIALKQKNGKAAFQSFSTAVKFDPDMVEARLEVARILFAAKAFDRAMGQVAEVLGRDPDNQGARFLQTSILLTQKKFDEAWAVLEGMDEAAKKGEAYFLLAASCHRASGDAAEAGTVLHRGLELNPDSLPLVLALVQYYGGQKDIENVETYLNKAIDLSPRASGLKFNLAWLYLGKKQPEKALEIVNQVLAGDAEDDRLRLAGAALLIKGGQLKEGLHIIHEGMAMHPGVYAYYGLLSELNLKTGKIAEAEKILREFLALGDSASRTDLIKARLNLSKLLLLGKRPDEAAALIDQVIEEDPKSVDAHYLMGRIYLAKGDGSGAVSKFRSVITDYPDHVDGYLGLANAHALNKDFDLALDVLKTARKKAPESTGILQALARVNMARKDPLAAEENLKQIISLDPYNLGSIAGLGDFYLAMNRYEDAIEQYRQLKDRKGGAPLGHLKTANALARQNKMDQAVDEMTLGYEANKKSSVFITSLAQLYLKQGRYREAVEKFKEAVQADANNRLAWFSLASTYERLEDYTAAMAVYEQILAKHPNSWMAANNLAFYLAELGTSEAELSRSLELAKAAEKLNPGDALVLDTLGWALYRNGEIEAARTHIEAAAEQRPDNLSIDGHLGEVYHHLGKADKAKARLEKVASGDMEFLGRARALALYNKHYRK